MIRKDLPEVLLIEKASFEKPKKEEELITLLRNRDVIGRVAEWEDQILGFSVHELRKDHVRLLRLAVHPDFRRKKVGTQLLTFLLTKGEQVKPKRNRVVGLVDESWLPAQLFLRSLRFKAVKVLRDARGRNDSYGFVYRFGEARGEEPLELQLGGR